MLDTLEVPVPITAPEKVTDINKAKFNPETQLKPSSRHEPPDPNKEPREAPAPHFREAGNYFHKILRKVLPQVINGHDDLYHLLKTEHLDQPSSEFWDQIKRGYYLDFEKRRVVYGNEVIANFTGNAYMDLTLFIKELKGMIPEGYKAYYIPEFGMCRARDQKEQSRRLDQYVKNGRVTESDIALYKLTGMVPESISRMQISASHLLTALDKYDQTAEWPYQGVDINLARALASTQTFALRDINETEDETEEKTSYVFSPEAVLDGLILLYKEDDEWTEEQIKLFDQGPQLTRLDPKNKKNRMWQRTHIWNAIRNDRVKPILFEAKLHTAIRDEPINSVDQRNSTNFTPSPVKWTHRIMSHHKPDTSHQAVTTINYAGSHFDNPIIRDRVQEDIAHKLTFVVGDFNVPLFDKNYLYDPIMGARLAGAPSLHLQESRYEELKESIDEYPEKVAELAGDIPKRDY